MMRRVAIMAWVVCLEIIRRKDVYVLLILLGALLFVLLSLNVFGLGGVVRYVMDVGLLFAWLFSLILGVTSAARQLPREESSRTIFPLLAKPVTRGELVIGKWLGAWISTVVATGVFYALVVAVTKLRGGEVSYVTLWQGFTLHGLALAMVGALAIWLSARLNFDAATACSLIFIGACFFVAPRVPEMLVYEQGPAANALLALYYALPHLELLDLRMRIVHMWGRLPWRVFAMLTGYGLVWTVLLLTLAWLAYRRKPLRRGVIT